MATINLPNGILVNGQLPLDGKVYFKTLAEMIDLGASDFKAYYYYDSMVALCGENQKQYIWRKRSLRSEDSLLLTDFIYPNGAIANGIDYSNERYNFYIYNKAEEQLSQETLVKGGIVGYLGVGLNYQVTPIELTYQGETSFIGRTPITLSNGDANNNRFDIVVLNLVTKIVSAKQGVPSINPQIPYYDPSTEYLLTTILIPQNATEPEDGNTTVYAENLQIAGGEFNTSTNNPGVITLNSLGDPDTGATCIAYNDPQQNVNFNTITFDSTINIPANPISSLFFRIKLDQATRGFLARDFVISLLDANDNLVSDIIQVKDFAAIETINDTTYQSVGLPFSLFKNRSFSKIVFQLRSFLTPLFIDNVQLVYGIPTTPQTSSSYLALTDTRDTTFLGKEGYIPKVIDGQLEFVPSDSALGSTFQRFFATADQTDFTITSNPSSLSFVSVQQGVATSDLWTYANGVLSFNEGLIVGTEVLAVWGGVNPNANQVNESNKTILLDTSLDSFTGTTINTVETIKSYVIPANTFIDGDLIRIKAKVNRLTGTANPGLQLAVGVGKLVNLVSNLGLDRHLVVKDGSIHRFPQSGNFPQDLDSGASGASGINFTNFAWDESINNVIDLQIQFEQIAVPEYQLIFLSIERIRQSV